MRVALSQSQIYKDLLRFGGNTLAVYERDAYACVDCGMTMEAHVAKYKRRLTINHIDGTGRLKVHEYGKSDNHPVINNSMGNLETLCLKCHGLKDGVRTTSNQYGVFKGQGSGV